MSGRPHHFRAVGMLVLATACWSVSFATMRTLMLVQQAALGGASTWFISSWCVAVRFGLAALILGCWSWRSLGQLTRSEFWQGVGLGGFSAGGMILQMDGLAHTDASTSAFLTQCYCLFIPLWVAMQEGQWPSLSVLASSVLVLVGIAILSRLDFAELGRLGQFSLGLGSSLIHGSPIRWDELRSVRGEVVTLLGSVFFTGQILWLQRPAFARNNVNRFSTVMFVTMAAVGVWLAAASAHQAGDWQRAYAAPSSWVLLALLVTVSTLGGFLLMNFWQPLVSATEAGLIYCAEPVFVSLLGLFLPALLGQMAGILYPNEPMGMRLVVGGGLITVANVWIQVAPLMGGRGGATATPPVGGG